LSESCIGGVFNPDSLDDSLCIRFQLRVEEKNSGKNANWYENRFSECKSGLMLKNPNIAAIFVDNDPS
jgi:hypothetical protein